MSCLVEKSGMSLMTTMRPRVMNTSLQSSEEFGGQQLRAEDSLMSALLPAVLTDVYPTLFSIDHSCLTQVPATYFSDSRLSLLALSLPFTSPGCPQMTWTPPPPTLVSTLSKHQLQMPDIQLPGEFAQAFHLETPAPGTTP